MSKVTGVPGTFYKSPEAERFYGDEQGKVGTYGVAVGTPDIPARSTIPCPYCHTLLHERHGLFARIITDFGDNNLVLDMVPATHLALSCPHCKQFFTVLRDR